MGGRVCTACAHAQRRDIDAAIVAGEAKRGIARHFGLSPDAVERHVKHVAQKVRTAEVKEARTLAGILDKSHRQVNAVIRRALADGEDDRVLRAIKERRELAALEFGTKRTTTVVDAHAEFKALPVDEKRERLAEMKIRVVEIEAEIEAEAAGSAQAESRMEARQ